MHPIELEQPSEAELIQQIKDAERELLMLDKDDQALCQLSLVIVLYYLNGGNTEGKQKALDIVEKFRNQYPIRSHFAAFKSRGFVKFTDKSYQSAINKALDTDVLEWHLTSGESGEFAGDYRIDVFTARDNYGVSEVKLHLPIKLIYDVNGRQEFADWINYLLEGLEVLHGYAGLNVQLPFDRHPYQFYEYQVTRQYWGLTPDGASSFKREWQRGTRSINWYSFIGKGLQEKFVGQPYYLDTMKAYPDLNIEKIGETLAFRAGILPRLGNKDLPLPLTYLVIAQLSKVVRSDMPSDAMHTAYHGPRYSLSQVYYWMRRWDNANFNKGILDPKGRKETLLPVLGEYGNDDSIVPYSGMWTPFDFEGLEQHLTQGQEFPEEGKIIRKSGTISEVMVVWRLVKRDDGGAVELQNPF